MLFEYRLVLDAHGPVLVLKVLHAFADALGAAVEGFVPPVHVLLGVLADLRGDIPLYLVNDRILQEGSVKHILQLSKLAPMVAACAIRVVAALGRRAVALPDLA